MKNFIFAAILLMSFGSMAQENSTATKFIHSTGAYSNAVRVDLGNSIMLIISGQVSTDKQGNLVGKDDMGRQTEMVYTNIKNIIEAEGGTMKHLVKTGVFIKDITKLQAFRDARNKMINMEFPPASTLVEITNLVNKDFLVEVEATAVIPKK